MNIRASLALVVPIVCIAQTQGPVITFEKTDYDFGKIDGTRKVTYRFKVTNTGMTTLNITRVSPSCGCTSTMLGKWSLAPGESSEMEVSFDPRGYRGEVHKSVQVTSDDPAHPNVTINFKADVTQEIMPSSSTIFLYDLQRTGVKTATIRLASGNGQPVKVKETKAPGAPYLSTSVKMDGNDAVMEISLDGSKIAANKRRGSDAITVITGSDKMPTIPITVQWEFKPAVLSTPEWVSWDEPAGKEHVSPIALKQASGKPFKVTGFKSSSPLITLKGITNTAAPQQNLQVVMAASAKADNYSGQLTILLDDPDQPELVLRVTANLH
jgi:hypothetical protein